MSRATELADALTDLLSAGTFSQTLIVERANIPGNEPENLKKDILVTIAPRREERSAIGRGRRQSEFQIDIGVQHLLEDPVDLERQDELLEVAEQIADFVEHADRRRITFGAALEVAEFMSVTIVVMDTDKFRTLGVFSGVVSCVYRVTRDG